MDKFRSKNGILWWNLRDGWPIISDAVVDYYGNRKSAYEAIKSVQRNQLVGLKDDGSVWAVNATRHAVRGHVDLTDAASGRSLKLDYGVPANDAVKIGDFKLGERGLVRIAWTCDGEKGRNHFLHGKPPFDWVAVLSKLDGI